MQPESTTCPKCKTKAEPGAVFCTTCGTRLPEPAANAGGDGTTVVSAPLSPPDASDSPRCGNCQSAVAPGALFCTGCGARASSAEATSSVANAGPATQAAAASAVAAAAQPAYEPPQAANSYSSTALGQAPGTRKTGRFVIFALVLLIAVAGAVLWLRPSAPMPGKVLILAPVQSSITVEPNSSTELGVAVQGDGGAGISWTVQESYGGRVEPAGVTAQGQQIIYKAAYHAGRTPGDYHVVAASAANRESQVAITVHVQR